MVRHWYIQQLSAFEIPLVMSELLTIYDVLRFHEHQHHLRLFKMGSEAIYYVLNLPARSFGFANVIHGTGSPRLESQEFVAYFSSTKALHGLQTATMDFESIAVA